MKQERVREENTNTHKHTFIGKGGGREGGTKGGRGSNATHLREGGREGGSCNTDWREKIEGEGKEGTHMRQWVEEAERVEGGDRRKGDAALEEEKGRERGREK